MKTSRPSVIIVAHGSTVSAEAHEAATQHAVTLRQSHRYGVVQTCFLAASDQPRLLPQGEIFLLPFFMSNGYFVTIRIPELFGLEKGMRFEPDRKIYQCDALGVDPELAKLIVTMVREICEEKFYAPSAVHVVLVAHGSSKSNASFEATRLQQAALEATGSFGCVSSVFLNQAPSLEEWLNQRVQDDIPLILVGLFAAEGPHATEDVPAAIEKRRREGGPRDKIHYAGAVGTRPEIVKLIQHSISRCAATVATEN